LNGENVLITIFLGGVPFAQSQIVKSVNISEVAVMHRDAFLGSDADDPDKQTRGWDAKIESFVADHVFVKALMDREQKRQARLPYDEMSIGLVFLNRDGTNDGFVLKKCEPKTDINSPGASERMMHSFDVQAKYYRPVAL
jgi:hypothetical protein